MGSELVAELRKQGESDREIFDSLHKELRRIARAKMRRERPDHTLQATALVNEAFLKLFKKELPASFWEDPARAVRFIAHAMEEILNDHADARNAQKRGGAGKRRVPLDEQQARDFSEVSNLLDEGVAVAPEQSEAVLSIRESLRVLRAASPRQAEVVQLYFYGALTYEEIAAALDVSLETVKLDLRKAKAFLKVHLSNT